MEIQHVICYAFFVDKDYKILRIMEMGCIDMMNKYAELIVKKGVNLQKGQKLVVTADVECASLVKAIAKEGSVKEVLSGDFISAYRLRAASSVSAALKKLQESELVYQTANGYMVYDRFMGEWLRRQVF